MILKTLLHSITKSLELTPNWENDHHKEIVQLGRVVPDANRCVQCGVCVFNCPIGIPVRDYAHRGLPVDDPDCIACGQCILVCPRGTLRWETQTHIFVADRFAIAADPVDTSDELNTSSLATGEI